MYFCVKVISICAKQCMVCHFYGQKVGSRKVLNNWHRCE